MKTAQPAPITLLSAGAGELGSVMEVMNAAFDPAFGEAWTRTQCAGILPMHGVSMTLANEDERPVGFTLARHVADEAELLLLAVKPTARGRGIGSALLKRFMDDARAKGVHRVHLEVRDGNSAVDIYARHQFSIEGRRPNYYKGLDGASFDALTMARSIDVS